LASITDGSDCSCRIAMQYVKHWMPWNKCPALSSQWSLQGKRDKANSKINRGSNL